MPPSPPWQPWRRSASARTPAPPRGANAPTSRTGRYEQLKEQSFRWAGVRLMPSERPRRRERTGPYTMPSCRGISIDEAAGLGCEGADAGLLAGLLAGLPAGLITGTAVATGVENAGGAGFAAAGRTGFAAGAREAFADGAFAAGFAAALAGGLDGVFARATLAAAGVRDREAAAAGLRAAAEAGFDATFFTSTSTIRESGPGCRARRRARRESRLVLDDGGRTARAPTKRLQGIIARPSPG